MGNEKSLIEDALRRDNFPGTIEKFENFCDNEEKTCKKDDDDCINEYSECMKKVIMFKAYVD